jgi:hypothetical protein
VEKTGGRFMEGVVRHVQYRPAHVLTPDLFE